MNDCIMCQAGIPRKYPYSARTESGELRRLMVSEEDHKRLQILFAQYPEAKLIIKD